MILLRLRRRRMNEESFSSPYFLFRFTNTVTLRYPFTSLLAVLKLALNTCEATWTLFRVTRRVISDLTCSFVAWLVGFRMHWNLCNSVILKYSTQLLNWGQVTIDNRSIPLVRFIKYSNPLKGDFHFNDRVQIVIPLPLFPFVSHIS